MALLALGISFRRAPIDLLERLAFTDDDLVKAYRRVQDMEGVDEAVVLSTCNRVEIYGSVPNYHAGFLTLKRLLAETRGVPEAELADGLYAHWERDAVEHLFSVAGGLDSMVLGETQIQSQVREALRLAEGETPVGSHLKSLFHAAARAGRRSPPGDVGRRRARRVRRASRHDGRGGARRPDRAVGRGDRRRHDGLAHREAPAAPRRGAGADPEPLARARSLAGRTDRRGARRSRCPPRGDPRGGPRRLRDRRRGRGRPGGRACAPLGRAMHPRSCCSTWPCRATWSPRPDRSPA